MTTTLEAPSANGLYARKAQEFQAQESQETQAAAPSLSFLDVDNVMPSALNPRKHFDGEALQELADSIAAHGLQQPIVVRRRERWPVGALSYCIAPADVEAQVWSLLAPDGAVLERVAGREAVQERIGQLTFCDFEIVMGERRWRAHGLAGLRVIPALVREGLDDKALLMLAMEENVRRNSLTPLETARGFRAMMEAGWTQAQIGGTVGRGAASVSQSVSLLDLPESVLAMIEDGRLSPSHGRALVRYEKFPAVAEALAQGALNYNLSSKSLEKGVAGLDWSARQAAEKAGAIASLCGQGTQFDWKAVCRQCPFGAFVADSDYSAFCLKPEHYKELNKAAQAQKRAELKAAQEQAKRASPDGQKAELPKLAKMGYETYREVRQDSYDNPAACCQFPAGAEGACPCRGRADGASRGVVQICTDPARFRQMQAQEKRDKQAEARSQVDAELARILPALDAQGGAAFGGMAAVVAVWTETVGAGAEHLRAAAERQGVAFDAGLLDQCTRTEESKAAARAQLAALGPDRLLRLAVEACLRHEAASFVEAAGTSYACIRRPALDWLRGPVDGPPADEDPAGGAPPEAEYVCDGCGERLTPGCFEGVLPSVMESVGDGSTPFVRTSTGELLTALGESFCEDCGPHLAACCGCGAVGALAAVKEKWPAPDTCGDCAEGRPLLHDGERVDDGGPLDIGIAPRVVDLDASFCGACGTGRVSGGGRVCAGCAPAEVLR